MFASFFPRPKLFFLSAVIWTALGIAIWYGFLRDLGEALSLGHLFGFSYPAPLAEGADDAAKAAFEAANIKAVDVWLYQFMIAFMAVFCAIWRIFSPHRWYWWSVVVSAFILFVTWFLVQLDVLLNNWYGAFYDLVQKALTAPNTVSQGELYDLVIEAAVIITAAVSVYVLSNFVISHFVFRWRWAMNDYYVSKWPQLRRIEGASQRIQEDTMRFAKIMESLGESFIDTVMTLIAFLPILWTLSEHVKVLPLIGEVPRALVWVAIIWAAFGTALLALVGIRLPGLEFRNQRVEAAYRKELVFGEDHENRAHPLTLAELFNNVRRNYFRLYFNYMYFNIARRGYILATSFIPIVALVPSIAAAGFTLGIMQQIMRAFSRVESSFQFLVYSWTTIVELISIYKRLKAFEATLEGEDLSGIELEVVVQGAE